MKSSVKKVDSTKHVDFIRISNDFFNGSESAYTFEYYNAAGVLIIHAAIALADAITIKLASKKCSGESHYDILSLLKEITPASTQKKNALLQFKKLIDHKNLVSYSGDIYYKKDIDKLMQHFERFKKWAEQL